MDLLVTGFPPWDGVKRNPSGELAAVLNGHVLPVDYDVATVRLKALIEDTRPRAILMLGLAEGTRKIALETQALNMDHCETGRQRRWKKRIVSRGEMLRPTRLPVDRLHAKLRRARIPVRLSHHAGTFVCNHVFYQALRFSRVPCGFVHVPPTKAIPFRTQLRAARLILEELKKRLL